MRCIFQPTNDAFNQVLQERGESEALLVKVTSETRINLSLFYFSVYPSLQNITGYLYFQPEQFIMDLVSLFVKFYYSHKGEERAASLPQILHLRPEGCRGILSTPSYFLSSSIPHCLSSVSSGGVEHGHADQVVPSRSLHYQEHRRFLGSSQD